MNTLENEHQIYEGLIIQYLSETISREDLSILNEWIELSLGNKQYFDRIREIWLLSKVVTNPKGFDSMRGYQRFLERAKIESKEKKEHTEKRVFFSLQHVAAALLIAFGLGVLTHYLLQKFSSSSDFVAQQEFIVPFGSKSKIRLPDGTTVTLNAGSRLTYKTDFGKTNREVWLEGEGYFSVSKDKKRTFIVKTGYLDIKALGTEFNVKAYPCENIIQTTLVEGSVKIEKNFKTLAGDLKASSIILTPKQRYTFLIDSNTDHKTNTEATKGQGNQKTTVITPKKGVVYKNIDPIPDISWKERRWLISKEQLGELAVKLERRYDVSITFSEENLKSFRFTGTLQDESIEQVLKVISLSSPIVFEIEGKQVIFHKNNEFAQKYEGLYKSGKH